MSIGDPVPSDEGELTLDVNGVQIQFVRINGGYFTMGSTADESGHQPNESPATLVEITSSFYISKYEITREQYQLVMGLDMADPEIAKVAMNDLSFNDAIIFCARISELSGKSMRLPTEAEWEYACRAGSTTPFNSGATESELGMVAWYAGNSNKKPQVVGEKLPNDWGLYDMHGNVWEYCSDFHQDYASMSRQDPEGMTYLNQGAIRGGGAMNKHTDCRSARRMISDDYFGGVGIRLVLDIGG